MYVDPAKKPYLFFLSLCMISLPFLVDPLIFFFYFSYSRIQRREYFCQWVKNEQNCGYK